MEPIAVKDVVASGLRNLNKKIADEMRGDCIFVCADMLPPLDDEFRHAVETIRGGRRTKSAHLIVVLETQGGMLEVAERLVSVMRKHYKKVSFVVPSHAYSAGTVLVMSGDDIYMDYYSVLGPIDPQFDAGDGTVLPGSGYLAKYKELLDTVNKAGVNNSVAELAYLTSRFDPAKLFMIEQSLEHGQSLIAEWLQKYKFRDWKRTQRHNKTVTRAYKRQRAEHIAAVLADAERWHSHGKGITMRVLQGRAIKLHIRDLGANENLSVAVSHYHGMAIDFARTNGIVDFIHSPYTYTLRKVS